MARGADDNPTEEEGALASSRTRLLALLPSASSTDRPSRTNPSSYGSSNDDLSKNDSAASFELLLPTKHSERNESALTSKIHRYCRKRPAIVAGVLIAFCGLVALIICSIAGFSGIPFHGPSGTKKYHQLTATEREPFSTLDPLKDLGLYSLERPKESSPPESVYRDTPQRALPTNAWYQNFLMAKGEPTNVHRAYAQPYVVDAVGPIPGLRAHPNHLDASTTVVQLSFVDSHGLTLGAAASKAQKKSPTKTYSVVSTTALAATLKWVSGTRLLEFHI